MAEVIEFFLSTRWMVSVITPASRFVRISGMWDVVMCSVGVAENRKT
jgi:hypothetical protein